MMTQNSLVLEKGQEWQWSRLPSRFFTFGDVTPFRFSSLLLLLVLGLATPPLAAIPSAFRPALHTRITSSFLTQNPLLSDPTFLDAPEGISHPFRTKDTFLNALADAFGTQEPENCLVSYRHQDTSFKADMNIFAGYESNFIDADSYGFWYKGWNLNAMAGQHVTLKSSWYNGAYGGDLDLAETNTLIDGYYKRFSDHIQLDNMISELSYQSSHLNLALGRGRFPLGNNISGSIVLSDKVNDYAFLKAEGQAGTFTLSFLHASLIADSSYATTGQEYVDTRNLPDKYVAVHQLSYKPRAWLDLFAGETVVYGNRSLDLNYLLPNSFWRAVEHNAWDRDNVLMFGGVNLSPNSQTLVYLNAALDEFSYSKFFTNWWGNKYAVQAGVSYQPDLKFLQRRYTLELTAVRPFTYTHFMNHTMYSHDGRSLGYAGGSNLINISFEANHQIKGLLAWDAQVSYSKRGSVGNDWRENYHDVFGGQIDTANAGWLEGVKSDEYKVQNNLKILIFSHHRFLIGHISKHTEDWLHHAYASWQFFY